MGMSLHHYRALLPVNKHNLDDALEIQANTQEEISRELALANSKALEEKDRLAQIEGELADKIKDDDPSLSIPKVDAKVRRHRDRVAQFERWMRAREEHEQWLGMLDAWKARGYSIKTLAALYGEQYYAPRSAGPSYQTDTTRSRSAMREAHNRTTTRRRID